MSFDAQTFGAALRVARKRQRMSQAQLAARSGITPSTISNLETGKGDRRPMDQTVDALAEALDVEADELLSAQVGEDESLTARVARLEGELAFLRDYVYERLGAPVRREEGDPGDDALSAAERRLDPLSGSTPRDLRGGTGDRRKPRGQER